MQLEAKRTALVFADLQNEFLEPFGSYYPMIADKLKELHVYDNIEKLLQAAQDSDIFTVHSPHYYYPTDLQWVASPQAIADYLIRVPNGFVARSDPVSLDGFVGSGADYPERLKKYLMNVCVDEALVDCKKPLAYAVGNVVQVARTQLVRYEASDGMLADDGDAIDGVGRHSKSWGL
ncbi:hypothetical protein NQ176_g6165 [Zarea fungicola]|uniref:Uncharacterized protein n=1 Tax=Zarea fungicola TaxID=93591 RepID=A0ACC1N6X6_9HYPO|nr:hypothetical protein NQ176_g6165 [Lecanicillium fungicola]